MFSIHSTFTILAILTLYHVEGGEDAIIKTSDIHPIVYTESASVFNQIKDIEAKIDKEFETLFLKTLEEKFGDKLREGLGKCAEGDLIQIFKDVLISCNEAKNQSLSKHLLSLKEERTQTRQNLDSEFVKIIYESYDMCTDEEEPEDKSIPCRQDPRPHIRSRIKNLLDMDKWADMTKKDGKRVFDLGLEFADDCFSVFTPKSWMEKRNKVEADCFDR